MEMRENAELRAILICCAIAVALNGSRLFAADAEVTGTFNGNDQPAKLAFVSIHKGTPVGGKETLQLVFTEKDHSKDEQPGLNALFGHFGSALVIGIQPADGKVVTCDIVHQALTQKPISSPTSVKMQEFKNEGGFISGKLATNGKDEAFGQNWEVNLTFKAKAP